MLTRRSIATGLGFLTISGAALGLVACASNTASGNVSVPSLAQVKGWVNVLNVELPLFVQESINTGLLKGDAVTSANLALKTFQTLATQILSPTFSVDNATQTIGQLSIALTSVLAVIPATAPYVGFIQLGAAVIVGFIAATPMIVPSVPTSLQLASMHKATVRFQK